ncbi:MULTISPECIES: C40 family peptidase [Streptomyces]|uniref:Glycoside hydrolase n=1 Tax=Streptomyces lycii TaxID=2654337 RepID=A0ABQ7FLT5_9ACTN|nr:MULTISPECIES: C40 family peptidase [Streptomyces]KAF4409916.1 glycoside hydrolase [Streptomyces lycii]PGH48639.1 glycoside hydrolase [Streptomyces sp. Ru87]
MASHRKPRSGVLQSPATRRTAVGLGSAALASVTLLSSQSAQAAPNDPGDQKQSIEDVQRKVDELYRQAGSATQKYNQAKERSDRQRTKVDGLLDQVARRTDKLNEARRALGTFATAQYRNGGMSPTATMLLASDPQSYYDQTRVMDRMTAAQERAVEDYREKQREAAGKRAEASASLETLTETQAQLRTSKQSVQGKLAEARELLSKLTAEERARLAAIERKKEEEAERKAEELARQEAERQRREEARREREREQDGGSGTGSGATAPDSTKAQQAIDFARSQIGKPYVWGASGPNSYDCSGLTQAAWKAAGVSLPRTTYDQVETGTTVGKAAMRPGDLIFFYDDISHVGLYIGDGQMIHAPKPGANVRVESVDTMPFHSAVRLA